MPGAGRDVAADGSQLGTAARTSPSAGDDKAGHSPAVPQGAQSLSFLASTTQLRQNGLPGPGKASQGRDSTTLQMCSCLCRRYYSPKWGYPQYQYHCGDVRPSAGIAM